MKGLWVPYREAILISEVDLQEALYWRCYSPQRLFLQYGLSYGHWEQDSVPVSYGTSPG